MSRGLFITGTGTGVGKTYVAALVAAALRASGKRVGVYKPVASGCALREGRLVSPDAVALWEAAGRPGTLEQVCPQRFAAPLAPHLAAHAEGRRVEPQLIREGIEFWHKTSDIVLVEGAGGLMSPLDEHRYNADWAAEFGYPLVVVAANVLGTINATLQTLITARSCHGGLAVAGVVLNEPSPNPSLLGRGKSGDPSMASNAAELRARCDAPLLTKVPHGGSLDGTVDWWALASE